MPIIPIIVGILIAMLIVTLPDIIRAIGEAIATARFGECDCDGGDEGDDCEDDEGDEDDSDPPAPRPVTSTN